MSHYCKSPPGGAMIQSNIMEEETNVRAKYSITGSIKYKKQKQKKICINRHIIKYYVITEHILIHGVAMETGFGKWAMLPLIQVLLLWPLIASHYSNCCLWQGHHPHIRTVHPNNRTAVSKETRSKNIKLSYQKERERNSQREMTEILVYPPSFYTFCCQCLTGSWLSRPSCFFLLTSLSALTHTHTYTHTEDLWVCMCICQCDAKWLACFTASPSLIFFLCLLTPWNVTLPGGQVSVFSRCRNKAVMAPHLLQYLSQAAKVAIRKMLGLPQVQDHSCRTGFGGKVVEIPEWMIVTKQRDMGKKKELNCDWVYLNNKTGLGCWADIIAKWFQHF